MIRSFKSLILSIAGISSLITIGGIIFTTSSKEKSPKAQEVIEPIQYATSDVIGKYTAKGYIDGEVKANECTIYWIEGITYNIETFELGFDKLKGKYDSLEKFFSEAKISQETQTKDKDSNLGDHVFENVCTEEHSKGYYYFWQEEKKDTWTCRIFFVKNNGNSSSDFEETNIKDLESRNYTTKKEEFLRDVKEACDNEGNLDTRKKESKLRR